MTARSLVLLFVAVATAGRLLLLAMGGVTPENAYFLMCAERPAPGYFDGPPGTALVVIAVAKLGGEWWNLLGPLWAAAASLAVWRLGRCLAGSAAAAGWGVVFLNSLPVFHREALQAGPVVPALALATVGASLAWEAWHSQSGGMRKWGLACLAFFGAGLFSALALPVAVGIAGWALMRQFGGASITSALALLAASVMGLAPWLVWLASVDWVPVGGWTLRGLLSPGAASATAGVVSAFLELSPVGLFLLPMAMWLCVRKAATRDGSAFAAWAGGAGLAVALFFMYRGWASGGVALFPAAILSAPALACAVRMWLWAGLAVIAGGWMSFAAFQEAARPRIEREAAQALMVLEERLRAGLPEGLFFIASDARLASALDYFLRQTVIPIEGHPRVYTPESAVPVSQFDFWPSYSEFREVEKAPDELFTEQMGENPFHGHAAFYISRESIHELPQAIRGAFAEVQQVQEVKLGRDRLYIYLCLDYQSLPL